MKKVVGWKRDKGNFTNRETGELVEWDNIILNLIVSRNSDPDLHGYEAVQEKIRYASAPAVLGRPYEKFDDLINQEVSLEYTAGKYPKLDEVRIVDGK